MTEIGNAFEMLHPGESALVLFTRGNHFVSHADGTGRTGFWKVAPHLEVDHIILYVRQPDRSNEIYTAMPAGVVGPNADGRYSVLLNHVERAGQSAANWFRFADTQAHPIRYLSRNPISLLGHK